MNITVSVHGRWHAFELAAQLQDRGELKQLLTTYPRSVVRSVTGRPLPVISKPSLELRRRIYDRLRLGSKPDAAIAMSFGRFAGRTVSKETDLFVGWSSASLEAISVVQGRGGKVVIERGSTHIGHQSDILQAGYDALGLQWEGIDPRIMERELAEYDAADAIAVPTDYSRQTFIDRGIPREKIIVNPYGTELGLPADRPNEDHSGPLRVLFAGGVGIRKGVPWLLDAMRELNGRAECRFAGPIDSAVRDKVSAGLPDNMQMLGPLSSASLARERANADIFCLPSIEEGFPLSVLEAMAAGLPCVVTPAASGGILEDGVNGLLVPPMDPGALVSAVETLASDRSSLRRYGNEARSTVQNGYTWKDYGDRAVAAYEALLA